MNRNKTKRPTAQPEDNSDNIILTIPEHKSLKVKHLILTKLRILKRVREHLKQGVMQDCPNDPPLNLDTQDEDILIADEYNSADDSEYAVGSDEIGFYTFFLEGQGNPPDFMGIEDDQLLAIQNDLHERLKARDEARERAVSNKLCELEQKHEFTNAKFLKHFAQVSELLEPTAKDAQTKVKLADIMFMLPPLFDGEKCEKAKTHYKRFNQYIKFQTKEGNIKDTTKKAI